jgi:hypothetical protein
MTGMSQDQFSRGDRVRSIVATDECLGTVSHVNTFDGVRITVRWDDGTNSKVSPREIAPILTDAEQQMAAQWYAPIGSLVLSSYWGTVDQVLAYVRCPVFGVSVQVMCVEHPAQRQAPTMLHMIRTHSTRLDRRDVIVGQV